MMVSSKTTSSRFASSNVEPDNTVFLNTAPFRSDFPKFTRSITAFEKFTPAASSKPTYTIFESHIYIYIYDCCSWLLTLEACSDGVSFRHNDFRHVSTIKLGTWHQGCRESLAFEIRLIVGVVAEPEIEWLVIDPVCLTYRVTDKSLFTPSWICWKRGKSLK